MSTQPIDPDPLTLNPVAQPSILHAHNLAAWQYAVLAAWGTGVRIVYTQHGANAHNQRLVDRLRGRLLALFTDEVVAVSKATARTMGRLLWIPRSGIRVVANGVDVERVQGSGFGVQLSAERRRVREQLGIPANVVVLGSVGRLAQVKGYDRLIKALGGTSGSQEPESGRRNPEPRTLNPPFLLLVGDGPERAALTALTQSLGLSDRVRFAGFQSEPRGFLDAMELFVLPSRSEGLSMGLLEAMAAGVPVAVTDAGANREVVDNGACGILLPEDESLWPAIFQAALENRADLSAMAERARRRVRLHYSLRATLDAYESLYRRLTSGGRGGCGDDCACGKR